MLLLPAPIVRLVGTLHPSHTSDYCCGIPYRPFALDVITIRAQRLLNRVPKGQDGFDLAGTPTRSFPTVERLPVFVLLIPLRIGELGRSSDLW